MLGRYPVSDVPPLDAALYFLVGIGAVAYAVLGKQFYWATRYGGSTGKLAPRWAGRLIFGSVGLFFLTVGAYNLWLR